MATCNKKVEYRIPFQRALRAICKEFKIPYDNVHKVTQGCHEFFGYNIRGGNEKCIEIHMYWEQHGRKKRRKVKR